ncbi:cyclase [Rhodobacteraceae bacterium WD3A24]|nr:cyclase [Rhodobacteraceae bacterium WD3A24]
MTDAIDMRERNWGRWGDDDERGAGNLLTPERVAAAAGLVGRGDVYPLGLPIGARTTPVPPNRPGPQHYMTRDGGDFAAGLRRKGGFETTDGVVMMGEHVGTHVDALAHVGDEGRLFNDHPLSGVRSNGAATCGIEKLPAIVGRGVLLDVCALKGTDRLDPQYVITDDDLAACAERQSLTVEAGTIVLVRTGWLSTFREEGAAAFFLTEPGIGMAAAEWLAARDVVAVGADNYGIEVVPTEDGRPGPVHRALVRDCGIYLMEMLVLDELAAAGVPEFLFVAAPLPITGGVGSPLNPLAIT